MLDLFIKGLILIDMIIMNIGNFIFVCGYFRIMKIVIK